MFRNEGAARCVRPERENDMIHSLTDLMQHRLHVADRKVRVDDAFFDPEARRLRYLAVDIGGWFSVDEVIVSADLLVPPGDGRDHWSLRLDEDALRAAPRWGAEGFSDPPDLTGWPPIIVGPFGGTYAPMLLYEQMVARDRTGEPPAEGSGDALVYRMDRASEWMGLPAYGTDGELGQVEDILFDDATMAIAWLKLGSGGLLSRSTGAVPITALRHMAQQGTHLVFDVTAAEAAASEPPV
jgi:hypothetical protein